MLNPVRTAALLGLAMLLAWPLFASIPRDLFPAPSYPAQNDIPSENRVMGSKVQIIIAAGFLPIQDMETHRVTWVPAVQTASGILYFLQTDPIGSAGGYNLYLFGEGAPSVYIDPTGEFAWVVIGGLIAGGIDFGVQAYTLGIDNVNYASVGISAAAGATGVGLGGAISRSVATASGRVALNAIGNAAIGTVSQVGQNVVRNAPLTQGVGSSAGINFMLGGASGVVGELAEAGGRVLANRAFDSAPPLYKYLSISDSFRAPAGPSATAISRAGNLTGQIISNSGPLFQSPSTSASYK